MSLGSFHLGPWIQIDLEFIADDLADDLSDDDLIKFIMMMDARKADVHFTNRLIVALNNSLLEELG